MNIKRKKRNAAGISDSGALSDLAFLLIIFFIVIAVFNVNKGFILGLPQKNSTKIINVNEILKVTLGGQNELTFEGKRVGLAELEELTKERLAARPNMTFLLKIHPEANYQEVVNVVDLVRGLEVENFSFSLLKEEE